MTPATMAPSGLVPAPMAHVKAPAVFAVDVPCASCAPSPPPSDSHELTSARASPHASAARDPTAAATSSRLRTGGDGYHAPRGASNARGAHLVDDDPGHAVAE